MVRASFRLSIAALLAAALAYSVTHWAFPPVGFEGMIAVAGFSRILTVGCLGLAFVLCLVLLVKGPRRSVPWTLLACAMAVGVLYAGFAVR